MKKNFNTLKYCQQTHEYSAFKIKDDLTLSTEMVVSHDQTSKQESIILRTRRYGIYLMNHMSLIEVSKNCRPFLHSGKVSTVVKNNDNNVFLCCFDMLTPNQNK